MYRLYESTIGTTTPYINTSYTGDGKINSGGYISLPSDCVYINIINMSPFKIGISLSGGQLDEYIEPNSKKENIYIGKQGGTGLTIGGNLQTTASIKIISVNVPQGVTATLGDLTILGKKVNENWTGLLPLVAGSVVPTFGANVILTGLTASSITFPSPDNWIIQEDGGGNLQFTNTTTGEVFQMGANGGWQGGAFTSDLESGQTVARTFPSLTSQNFILQINGLNFGFFTDGSIGIPQRIASVNGVTTSGFQGVPLIIGSGNLTNITSTALTSVASGTTPAGLYRASGMVNINNGGSSQVSFYAQYNDVHGVTRTAYFIASNGVNSIFSTVLANGDYPAATDTFYHNGSGSVTIFFQDALHTPNDYAMAIIEKLV